MSDDRTLSPAAQAVWEAFQRLPDDDKETLFKQLLVHLVVSTDLVLYLAGRLTALQRGELLFRLLERWVGEAPPERERESQMVYQMLRDEVSRQLTRRFIPDAEAAAAEQHEAYVAERNPSKRFEERDAEILRLDAQGYTAGQIVLKIRDRWPQMQNGKPLHDGCVRTVIKREKKKRPRGP
jgi:hypothetical protein